MIANYGDGYLEGWEDASDAILSLAERWEDDAVRSFACAAAFRENGDLKMWHAADMEGSTCNLHAQQIRLLARHNLAEVKE